MVGDCEVEMSEMDLGGANVGDEALLNRRWGEAKGRNEEPGPCAIPFITRDSAGDRGCE